MGGVEKLEEQASFRSWPVPAPDNQSDADRAKLYRQSAKTLRQLATQVRFDFGRRQQLVALADAFDRLAARLEGSPMARTAD